MTSHTLITRTIDTHSNLRNTHIKVNHKNEGDEEMTWNMDVDVIGICVIYVRDILK